MSEWNLYFKVENGKIFDVIKALKKNNLLEFMELSDEYGKNKKKIEFRDLPLLKQIKDIRLGWHISSYLYNDSEKNIKKARRAISIHFLIVPYDNNGKITDTMLNLIKVVGESLNPVKFEIVCNQAGPKPLYQGDWDFVKFKKEILPEIEY